MASQRPQRIYSGMNQSPRGRGEPSGSSNSHFTDWDEEEAECSGVIAIATHPATTLICRLGPEN